MGVLTFAKNVLPVEAPQSRARARARTRRR